MLPGQAYHPTLITHFKPDTEADREFVLTPTEMVSRLFDHRPPQTKPWNVADLEKKLLLSTVLNHITRLVFSLFHP